MKKYIYIYKKCLINKGYELNILNEFPAAVIVPFLYPGHKVKPVTDEGQNLPSTCIHQFNQS